MTTYKNLWEQFATLENFTLAAKKACKGKSKQAQVIKFKENFDENVKKVFDLVMSGKFTTSEYKTFSIYNNKPRKIYTLPLMPDRVVHHAVMNILKPIFTKHLITDTYSCVEGRGVHSASRKVAEACRKYKYCLQLDIRKFFPSIKHDILSKMIHRIIKDEKFMAIVDDIIYSIGGGQNVPLGNFTSQWFANWYLHDMDNLVKHKLQCRYYIRYCDDFVLFSNSKEELHRWERTLREHLESVLQLSVRYANIIPVECGISFCGYVHYKKYIVLRKLTVRKQQKQAKKGCSEQSLVSMKGHNLHCCSYRIVNNLEGICTTYG